MIEKLGCYFRIVECVGILVDAKEAALGFYEPFGSEPVAVMERAGRQVPAITPMYIPLGSIPRP